MAIQVGGTTVIDNSRNLVNLNIPGCWIPLATASMATNVSFDLANYGLGATSRTYRSYKFTFEKVIYQQSTWLSMNLLDSSLAPITSYCMVAAPYNGSDMTYQTGMNTTQLNLNMEWGPGYVNSFYIEMISPTGYNNASRGFIKTIGNNQTMFNAVYNLTSPTCRGVRFNATSVAGGTIRLYGMI